VLPFLRETAAKKMDIFCGIIGGRLFVSGLRTLRGLKDDCAMSGGMRSEGKRGRKEER